MTATSILLALLTLGSPPNEIQQPEPWASVRGEVSADDDGLEILAFDSDDQLVGTLIMSLPTNPEEGSIQIDASFPDAYVSAPLLLLDEDDLAAPEELEPSILTDLPLPEAKRRLEEMLGYIADADLGLDIGVDGQRMTKKQCVVAFGLATVVCATATLSANIGIALGCVSSTTTAVCGCTKYVPIKLCDD